ERQSLLKRAIKRLPDRQRQVFLLKHKEGLKISEIAEVFGCPQGTVKANLFKAIRNLKNSMEDIK
ncbi:MAG: sigma-70 family RNA polymerase sigma factor, partial [Nitrospirae bacterium]